MFGYGFWFSFQKGNECNYLSISSLNLPKKQYMFFISLSSWVDLTDEVQLAIRQLVYCKAAFHKESWLFLLPWAPIWCVHMSPLFFAGHRVKGCNFEREVAQKLWQSCCFQDQELCKNGGQNRFIYMHAHAQAHKPFLHLPTLNVIAGYYNSLHEKTIQPCFCVFIKQTEKLIHMCPFQITLLLQRNMW